MKHAVAASALIALAAAKPQGGPPGGWRGGSGGPGWFSAFPACGNDCWSQVQGSCSSYSDYDCICSSDTISSGSQCLESSSCSDSEKQQIYSAVDQLCANVGVTLTEGPYSTISATSGGSAWPTAWATNSAWQSLTTGGPWVGGPPGGWSNAGGWGPFGHGAPGQGWGNWGSSGSWTNGPWTSWWGGDDCPPSTWSGWTSGPWGTSAPWTTWAGCTASTTASSVVTTTASNGSTITSTSLGYQVAAVTGDGSSGASSSSSDNAAPRATGFGLAASAAGALGVLGGALLL